MNAMRNAGPAVWVGRVLSGLIALFLLQDAAIHLLNLDVAVDATVELGFSEGTVPWIGVFLIVPLVLYVVPRTALIGAVGLTGYLGGAMAIQMQQGEYPWMLFPFLLGVLLWVGLGLRDARVATLIGPKERVA